MIRITLAATCMLAASIGYGQPSEDNPYMRVVKPRDWSMEAQVLLRPTSMRSRTGGTSLEDSPLEFRQASIYFPYIKSTASAMQIEGTSPAGTITANGDVISNETNEIEMPDGDWSIMQWSTESAVAMSILFKASFQVRTHETIFDERKARTLDWPSSWPDQVLETYSVPIYGAGMPAEGRGGPVADLINKWTEGNDPKSIGPVDLAKFLAGKVQEHFRTVDTSVRGGDGGTEYHSPIGLYAQDLEETINTNSGSRHDTTVMLAAVYRTVGIPCRVVIGFDDEGDGLEEIRSWVEFCLYDEAENLVTWVPVDIQRLRDRGSRMGPLDRPWKYFGTHDELDTVIPISFAFEPPTGLDTAGNPTLYGVVFRPQPTTTVADTVDIRASRAARRRSP